MWSSVVAINSCMAHTGKNAGKSRSEQTPGWYVGGHGCHIDSNLRESDSFCFICLQLFFKITASC